MSVGLLVVSHSAAIAAGVVELAGQMAEGVVIAAAGGTDEGGIGTSFDLVSAGLAAADSGEGVVVLCDLGSAVLTAETALDFLDEEARERVRIADAPIVEGAVAAAVASRTGAGLEGVLAAAESARAVEVDGPPAASAAGSAPGPAEVLERRATLVNRSGLHARPAAEFVKTAASFDARITVQGVDATSLLRIMSLGLGAGTELELTAQGSDAAPALDALVALVDSGFGED
ncbi:dihydroxyacetone kinase phosphoryl donor subunit DhaM [Homoserinibacter sp. YIM 151385]|uniref:dihydroxyacetone kinase phosphoryl donor subunit DhaM n=1 Tax=Homoserinibacter sp. YIM 151385 TaxID=2985506 RepID=UPI0022F03141|nr:dihydroxyacetone kinase phosphoryl donor subunit DhaM [Homoserinibacter sp. YIM 151385]WBU38710.1 dihydroxyacetone kinase phosphoryl donor subunit DhaM [Homoserinibacter sp. YIM 151385]